jgi:hypothetical protein
MEKALKPVGRVSVVVPESGSFTLNPPVLKLSVGVTSHPDLLDSEGPFTQESRPSRTFGESFGVSFALECSDWSNGLRYHHFHNRPDTEFKVEGRRPRRVVTLRNLSFNFNPR